MLHNAVGGGCLLSQINALQRCRPTVQCYQCYEGVGGGQIPRKKALRPTSKQYRMAKRRTAC